MMQASSVLNRVFSLSSFPRWLEWLPAEASGLAAEYLSWRKRTLLVILALLASIALAVLSAKLGATIATLFIIASWPLFLLPLSVWSWRLASAAISVLREHRKSGVSWPASRRPQLLAFTCGILAIPAISAATVVPWFLLVRLLVHAWFPA